MKYFLIIIVTCCIYLLYCQSCDHWYEYYQKEQTLLNLKRAENNFKSSEFLFLYFIPQDKISMVHMYKIRLNTSNQARISYVIKQVFYKKGLIIQKKMGLGN